MTIREFLDEVTSVFEKAGISCAHREALLLVCHVLSCEQIYVFTNKDEYVDEKILLAAAALVNERCKGRPLAYILGSADFCGIEITVDERVLIPRPETELLVEEILKSELKTKEGLRVLDLCTGSGCISAALAENLPGASILATDLSLRALQLANYNLRPYGNVKTLRSDLFEKIDGKFDIIVSNPPYVAEKYREGMQKEVRDFEPENALFAGEDGLDIIRIILAEAGNHLEEGGLFLMEIGDDQAEEVLRLAHESDAFSDLSVEKDLSGMNRYLKAKKA
jgi:release factor glutamine methyltransferase